MSDAQMYKLLLALIAAGVWMNTIVDLTHCH
jgi:hypothetical protein